MSWARRWTTWGALWCVVLTLVAFSVDASAQTTVPATSVAGVWAEPQAGYGFLDAAIAAARSSVELSMYELKDPTVEAALVARAHAGVDVQVLLNYAYYGHQENEAAFSTLGTGSVHVVWAPAGRNFHAKYLVVDRRRLFVGSGNLVAADYPSTRDFWVEDLTPRDVQAALGTFAQDVAHSPALPRGAPGLVWSPGSSDVLARVIATAHHSLLVENEEMASPVIEGDLARDARRGVSVEVVMTSDPSWTAALTTLAAAGVHVRLLTDSQVYVHAKVICADCTAAAGTVFVGSENFSTSSLSYNRELGVVTTSLAVVRAVRDAVSSDFAVGTALGAPSSGTPTKTPGPGLTITSIVATIARGAYESLSAHAPRAHETCSLAVVLPSGRTSAARGLEPALTDGGGDVTWHWRIGTSTDPGTATATLTCAGASVVRHFTITT